MHGIARGNSVEGGYEGAHYADPLSQEGALRAYWQARNSAVAEATTRAFSTRRSSSSGDTPPSMRAA
eukprot:CAMPEP_0185777776 /NCGR_PEP_ID=MMETSP1174-20130828/90667_1 /TAXON_ID=35687 /ORGANISM="Dictyocha speculum, Strain CCMP1381" /LENGTH=66 /DNA_ID=CAMNT_0028466273 /DNA_START=84 /DNA_END=281 /DNA_ORIENTATION=-